MKQQRPLIITGGKLVLAEDVRAGNVRCVDGRIVALGDVAPDDGDEVIDAAGKLVAPGLVDLGVFAVDEPVQELGVLGDAPVVRLASGDVGVQVVERADVHRLDVGDLPKALDLPASESNLRAEADHRRST